MKKYIINLLLTAIICAPLSLSAQVTIGSSDAPRNFSVLELISNDERGLRLPRMTTLQRIALEETPEFQAEIEGAAMGLKIFNLISGCVEVWSGSCWISMCEGDAFDDPCAGFENMRTDFCPGETIADLTDAARIAGGRGAVVWYDAAVGGNRFNNPNELLTTRIYWAANCANATTRQPVNVSLINCAVIPATAGRIAAFVSVMYDFQHQTLEAFTTEGGDVTSWQWQMSVRLGGAIQPEWWTGNEWIGWSDWTDVNLPGANTARLHIPAYFMYTHAGIPRGTDNQAPNASDIMVDGHRTNTVEIRFRSIMSSPGTTTPVATTPLEILFIRTNTSGFGGSGNERFLTIRRGLNGSISGGTIRISLLNVGADYNDGIGLGEFLQWGRTRVGGHSATDWRKNTYVARDHAEYRAPFIGDAVHGWGNTSAPVQRNRILMGAPDINGQVQATATGFVDRFIYFRTPTPDGHDLDWGGFYEWRGNHFVYPDRDDLWGNLAVGRGPRANFPTSLDGANGWTERARNNNPCPPGWRVPSHFDWWDIFRGNGNDEVATYGHITTANTWGNNTTTPRVNFWSWRHRQQNNVVGGAVITNPATNESIFLPAAGFRSRMHPNPGPGVNNAVSWQGAYHTSTLEFSGAGTNSNRPIQLSTQFLGTNTPTGSNIINAGSNGTNPVLHGYSVRCVQ